MVNRREFIKGTITAAKVISTISLTDVILGCLEQRPAEYVDLEVLVVDPSKYMDNLIMTSGFPEYTGEKTYNFLKRPDGFDMQKDKGPYVRTLETHKLHITPQKESPYIMIGEMSAYVLPGDMPAVFKNIDRKIGVKGVMRGTSEGKILYVAAIGALSSD